MSTLDASISLLGGMTIRTFMSEYWQQKPLLIRGGLTDFESPIDPDELAGLAMEEEVESRIVIEHGKQPWELRKGPFTEQSFESLPEKEWTLLVQAVDHWVPEVQTLKERFHFLPSWRLDDVMISYATEGGSVGPHYDQYDVFLVQVQGSRCWQTLLPNQYQDTPVADIDLHILSEFIPDPSQEWDLQAGDILYLPPNVAHNGRALDDECMTYSIGFRAPSIQDALTGLHDQLIETTDIKRRFAAPAIDDDVHHAEIHTQDLGYLQQEIRRLIDQPDMLLNWLGNTMSEAKYPEYQTPLTDEETQLALENALSGQPFFRPGDARICYGIVPNDTNKIRVFSHYDSIEVQEELTSLVQAIADQNEFDFSGLNVDANPDIKPLLLFLMKQLTLVELTEG